MSDEGKQHPDPKNITALATEFTNQGNRLRDLKTALSNQTTNLQWTGEAHDAAIRTVGSMGTKIDAIAQACDDMATSLNKMAKDVQDAINKQHAQDLLGLIMAILGVVGGIAMALGPALGMISMAARFAALAAIFAAIGEAFNFIGRLVASLVGLIPIVSADVADIIGAAVNGAVWAAAISFGVQGGVYASYGLPFKPDPGMEILNILTGILGGIVFGGVSAYSWARPKLPPSVRTEFDTTSINDLPGGLNVDLNGADHINTDNLNTEVNVEPVPVPANIRINADGTNTAINTSNLNVGNKAPVAGSVNLGDHFDEVSELSDAGSFTGSPVSLHSNPSVESLAGHGSPENVEGSTSNLHGGGQFNPRSASGSNNVPPPLQHENVHNTTSTFQPGSRSAIPEAHLGDNPNLRPGSPSTGPHPSSTIRPNASMSNTGPHSGSVEQVSQHIQPPDQLRPHDNLHQSSTTHTTTPNGSSSPRTSFDSGHTVPPSEQAHRIGGQGASGGPHDGLQQRTPPSPHQVTPSTSHNDLRQPPQAQTNRPPTGSTGSRSSTIDHAPSQATRGPLGEGRKTPPTTHQSTGAGEFTASPEDALHASSAQPPSQHQALGGGRFTGAPEDSSHASTARPHDSLDGGRARTTPQPPSQPPTRTNTPAPAEHDLTNRPTTPGAGDHELSGRPVNPARHNQPPQNSPAHEQPISSRSSIDEVFHDAVEHQSDFSRHTSVSSNSTQPRTPQRESFGGDEARRITSTTNAFGAASDHRTAPVVDGESVEASSAGGVRAAHGGGASGPGQQHTPALPVEGSTTHTPLGVEGSTAHTPPAPTRNGGDTRSIGGSSTPGNTHAHDESLRTETAASVAELREKLSARGLGVKEQYNAALDHWYANAPARLKEHLPSRSAMDEHWMKDQFERDVANDTTKALGGAAHDDSRTPPPPPPEPSEPVSVSTFADLVRARATQLGDRFSFIAHTRALDARAAEVAKTQNAAHAKDSPGTLSTRGYERSAADLKSDLHQALSKRYGPLGDDYSRLTGPGGHDDRMNRTERDLINDYRARLKRETVVEDQFKLVTKQLDTKIGGTGGHEAEPPPPPDQPKLSQADLLRKQAFKDLRTQVLGAQRAGRLEDLPAVRQAWADDLELLGGMDRWMSDRFASFQRGHSGAPLSGAGMRNVRAATLEALPKNHTSLRAGDGDATTLREQLHTQQVEFFRRLLNEHQYEQQLATVAAKVDGALAAHGSNRPWEKTVRAEATDHLRTALQDAGGHLAPPDVVRDIVNGWAAGLSARFARAAGLSDLGRGFRSVEADWRSARVAAGEPHDVPDSAVADIRAQYERGGLPEVRDWRKGGANAPDTETLAAKLNTHADTAKQRLTQEAGLTPVLDGVRTAAAGKERAYAETAAQGERPSPEGYARARGDLLDDARAAHLDGDPQRIGQLLDRYADRLALEARAESEFAKVSDRTDALLDEARGTAGRPTPHEPRAIGEEFHALRTKVIAAGRDATPEQLRDIRKEFERGLPRAVMRTFRTGGPQETALPAMFERGLADFRDRPGYDKDPVKDKLSAERWAFRRQAGEVYDKTWEDLGVHARPADVHAEWQRRMEAEVGKLADGLSSRYGKADRTVAARTTLTQNAGTWADKRYADLKTAEPRRAPSPSGFQQVRDEHLAEVGRLAATDRDARLSDEDVGVELRRLEDGFAGKLRQERTFEERLGKLFTQLERVDRGAPTSMAPAVRRDAVADLRSAVHAAGPDADEATLADIGHAWSDGLGARIDQATRLATASDRFARLAAETGARNPAAVRADFDRSVSADLRAWHGDEADRPHATAVEQRLDGHLDVARQKLTAAADRAHRVDLADTWAHTEAQRLRDTGDEHLPSAAGVNRAAGDHRDEVGDTFDETVGRGGTPQTAPRREREFTESLEELQDGFARKLRVEKLVEDEYARVRPSLQRYAEEHSEELTSRVEGKAFDAFRREVVTAGPGATRAELDAIGRGWSEGHGDRFGAEPPTTVMDRVDRQFESVTAELSAYGKMHEGARAGGLDGLRRDAVATYEATWREQGPYARPEDVESATMAKLQPHVRELADTLKLSGEVGRVVDRELLNQVRHFGDARITGDRALTATETRAIQGRVAAELGGAKDDLFSDAPGAFARPDELRAGATAKAWRDKLDEVAGKLPDWMHEARVNRLGGAPGSTYEHPGAGVPTPAGRLPEVTGKLSEQQQIRYDKETAERLQTLDRGWRDAASSVDKLARDRALLEQELYLRGHDSDTLWDRTVRAWRDSHPDLAAHLTADDIATIRAGRFEPGYQRVRDENWGRAGAEPRDVGRATDVAAQLETHADGLDRELTAAATLTADRTKLLGQPSAGGRPPEPGEDLDVPERLAGHEDAWRELRAVPDAKARDLAVDMYDFVVRKFGAGVSKDRLGQEMVGFFRDARQVHAEAQLGATRTVSARDVWLSRMEGPRGKLADELALTKLGDDMHAALQREQRVAADADAIGATGVERLRAVLDTQLRRAKTEIFGDRPGVFATRHEPVPDGRPPGGPHTLQKRIPTPVERAVQGRMTAWQGRVNDVAASMRERFTQEKSFSDAVATAAREFDGLMGGGSVRPIRVRPDTFAELALRHRAEYVGEYQRLHGLSEAETGRWLGHEAAHEDRFTSTLSDLRTRRDIRQWELDIDPETADALVAVGRAPLDRDVEHLLPDNYGGVMPLSARPEAVTTGTRHGPTDEAGGTALPESAGLHPTPEQDAAFRSAAEDLVAEFGPRFKATAAIDARRPDFAADFGTEVRRTGRLSEDTRFGSLNTMSAKDLTRWRDRFAGDAESSFESIFAEVARGAHEPGSPQFETAAARWERSYGQLRAQLRLDGVYRNELTHHEATVTAAVAKAKAANIGDRDIAMGVDAFARDLRATVDDLVSARPLRADGEPGHGDAFDPAHRGEWDAAGAALDRRLDQYLTLAEKGPDTVAAATAKVGRQADAWGRPRGATRVEVPAERLREQLGELGQDVAVSVRQRTVQTWLQHRSTFDQHEPDLSSVHGDVEAVADRVGEEKIHEFEAAHGGAFARDRADYDHHVNDAVEGAVTDLLRTLRATGSDISRASIERLAGELRANARAVDVAQRPELTRRGYGDLATHDALGKIHAELDAFTRELPARLRYERQLEMTVQQAGGRLADAVHTGDAPPVANKLLANDFAKQWLRRFDHVYGAAGAGLRGPLPDRTVDALAGGVHPLVDERMRGDSRYSGESVADSILARQSPADMRAVRTPSGVYLHAGEGEPAGAAYERAQDAAVNPEVTRVGADPQALESGALDYFLGDLRPAQRRTVTLDLSTGHDNPEALAHRLSDTFDVTVELAPGRLTRSDRLIGIGPDGGRVPLPLATEIRVVPSARLGEQPPERFGTREDRPGTFTLGDDWRVQVERVGAPGAEATFEVLRPTGPMPEGPARELESFVSDLTAARFRERGEAAPAATAPTFRIVVREARELATAEYDRLYETFEDIREARPDRGTTLARSNRAVDAFADRTRPAETPGVSTAEKDVAERLATVPPTPTEIKPVGSAGTKPVEETPAETPAEGMSEVTDHRPEDVKFRERFDNLRDEPQDDLERKLQNAETPEAAGRILKERADREAERNDLTGRLTRLKEQPNRAQEWVESGTMSTDRFGYRTVHTDVEPLTWDEAAALDHERAALKSGDPEQVEAFLAKLEKRGVEQIVAEREHEMPLTPMNDDVFVTMYGAVARARASSVDKEVLERHLQNIRETVNGGDRVAFGREVRDFLDTAAEGDLIRRITDLRRQDARDAGISEQELTTHEATLDKLLAERKFEDAERLMTQFREEIDERANFRKVSADNTRKAHEKFDAEQRAAEATRAAERAAKQAAKAAAVKAEATFDAQVREPDPGRSHQFTQPRPFERPGDDDVFDQRLLGSVTHPLLAARRVEAEVAALRKILDTAGKPPAGAPEAREGGPDFPSAPRTPPRAPDHGTAERPPDDDEHVHVVRDSGPPKRTVTDADRALQARLDQLRDGGSERMNLPEVPTGAPLSRPKGGSGNAGPKNGAGSGDGRLPSTSKDDVEKATEPGQQMMPRQEKSDTLAHDDADLEVPVREQPDPRFAPVHEDTVAPRTNHATTSHPVAEDTAAHHAAADAALNARLTALRGDKAPTADEAGRTAPAVTAPVVAADQVQYPETPTMTFMREYREHAEKQAKTADLSQLEIEDHVAEVQRTVTANDLTGFTRSLHDFHNTVELTRANHSLMEHLRTERRSGAVTAGMPAEEFDRRELAAAEALDSGDIGRWEQLRTALDHDIKALGTSTPTTKPGAAAAYVPRKAEYWTIAALRWKFTEAHVIRPPRAATTDALHKWFAAEKELGKQTAQAIQQATESVTRVAGALAAATAEPAEGTATLTADAVEQLRVEHLAAVTKAVVEAPAGDQAALGATITGLEEALRTRLATRETPAAAHPHEPAPLSDVDTVPLTADQQRLADDVTAMVAAAVAENADDGRLSLAVRAELHRQLAAKLDAAFADTWKHLPAGSYAQEARLDGPHPLGADQQVTWARQLRALGKEAAKLARLFSETIGVLQHAAREFYSVGVSAGVERPDRLTTLAEHYRTAYVRGYYEANDYPMDGLDALLRAEWAAGNTFAATLTNAVERPAPAADGEETAQRQAAWAQDTARLRDDLDQLADAPAEQPATSSRPDFGEAFDEELTRAHMRAAEPEEGESAPRFRGLESLGDAERAVLRDTFIRRADALYDSVGADGWLAETTGWGSKYASLRRELHGEGFVRMEAARHERTITDAAATARAAGTPDEDIATGTSMFRADLRALIERSSGATMPTSDERTRKAWAEIDQRIEQNAPKYHGYGGLVRGFGAKAAAAFDATVTQNPAAVGTPEQIAQRRTEFVATAERAFTDAWQQWRTVVDFDVRSAATATVLEDNLDKLVRRATQPEPVPTPARELPAEQVQQLRDAMQRAVDRATALFDEVPPTVDRALVLSPVATRLNDDLRSAHQRASENALDLGPEPESQLDVLRELNRDLHAVVEEVPARIAYRQRLLTAASEAADAFRDRVAGRNLDEERARSLAFDFAVRWLQRFDEHFGGAAAGLAHRMPTEELFGLATVAAGDAVQREDWQTASDGRTDTADREDWETTSEGTGQPAPSQSEFVDAEGEPMQLPPQPRPTREDVPRPDTSQRQVRLPKRVGTDDNGLILVGTRHDKAFLRQVGTAARRLNQNRTSNPVPVIVYDGVTRRAAAPRTLRTLNSVLEGYYEQGVRPVVVSADALRADAQETLARYDVTGVQRADATFGLAGDAMAQLDVRWQLARPDGSTQRPPTLLRSLEDAAGEPVDDYGDVPSDALHEWLSADTWTDVRDIFRQRREELLDFENRAALNRILRRNPAADVGERYTLEPDARAVHDAAERPVGDDALAAHGAILDLVDQGQEDLAFGYLTGTDPAARVGQLVDAFKAGVSSETLVKLTNEVNADPVHSGDATVLEALRVVFDTTSGDLGHYETVPSDVRTIISRRRLSLTDGQHRNIWARGLRDLREQYPEKKAALETLAEMVMDCNKNFDDSWS